MGENKICKWCGRWYVHSLNYCSQRCELEHRENLRSRNSSRRGYPSNNSKAGSCFIATSVYGNYDHPIVFDLRQFRDNWLDKKKIGKKFIQWYYYHGPKLASWIDKSQIRKKIALILIVKPLHIFVKFFKLHK